MHTRFPKKFISGAVLSFVAISVEATIIYTLGHGDIGVTLENQQSSPELALKLHADPFAMVGGSMLNAETAYAANAVTIQIPETARRTVPFDIPEAGVADGEELWIAPQVRSQADDAGSPWLGLATDEVTSPGDWTNDFIYDLVEVNGPSGADFSVWQSLGGGGLLFHFSTVPGAVTNENNRIPMRADSHDHFNWGFSAPGTWEVTLNVTGTHVDHGNLYTTETFTFSVVPEPAASGLISALVVGLAACFRRPRRFFNQNQK
jgi:surface-anchored protein